MTSPPDASPDDVAKYAQRLLVEAREELNRADTKASIAFGVVGIAAGAVLGGIIGGDWNPGVLGALGGAAWWTGAVGVVFSIGLIAAAVYPRVVHTEGRDQLTFFEHAAAYDSVAELRSALAVAAARANGRDTDQLHHVSKIVSRKYRLVRWGLRVLAGSVVLLVLPVVACYFFGR